jgi:cytidylate kinase
LTGPRIDSSVEYVPHRVVCISSVDGAGGEEVGRLVAERLGLRLIDEEIIVRAAREAGVDSHVVADAEQRKSLAARVLREILAGSVAVAPALGVSSPASSRDALDDSDDFRGLIRTAIEEIAEESECVIVAHAASVALSGRAGILRALVTASADTRGGCVARENGIDDAEATERIVRSDAARADYLKRFYGLKEEPPTLYDLVLNTDRLSPEQAAQLIAEAAGHHAASEQR